MIWKYETWPQFSRLPKFLPQSQKIRVSENFGSVKTDWNVTDFSCVLYYKATHALFHLSKTIPRNRDDRIKVNGQRWELFSEIYCNRVNYRLYLCASLSVLYFLNEVKCPGTKNILRNVAWCDLAEPRDNWLSNPSSDQWNWAISANILLSSDIFSLKKTLKLYWKISDELWWVTSIHK